MKANTWRTVLGFVGSVIRRRTGAVSAGAKPDGVFNYLAIDGLFPTSGQPAEAELEAISRDGYEMVINLAPTSVLENSVVDEAAILERLGVEYVHIPVDFQAPSDADFQTFRDALQQAGPRKVWVHCAANMRVSAFTYRYRVQVLDHAPEDARRDLEKIWEPFGVWRTFLGFAK